VAKIFLGYQYEKGCEAFLIFQILFLLSALMCRGSENIQFANFKINFLVNQSEYRKSLTPFCSLSATDWHCAVCLVVLAITKAGNSVKQIVSVLHLKACTRLPLIKSWKKLFLPILHFVSFTMIPYILFYGYDMSGAHMNDSSEDTPEGLQ